MGETASGSGYMKGTAAEAICTTRQLEEILGSSVAAAPGIMLAPFITKDEHEKNRALKLARGDYSICAKLYQGRPWLVD